jgi:hypothetical protein
MPDGANIRSIESLARLKAFLYKWAEDVRQGMMNADGEVRRISDWLEHQQPAYWSAQLQRRQGALEEAKQELSKKLYGVTNRDNPPSTVYERKMVQKAKAAVLEAEEKLKTLKLWRLKFAKEAQSYSGATAGARLIPDAIIPKASAYLEALRDHLERYVAVAGAAPVEPPSLEIEAPSVARARLEEQEPSAASEDLSLDEPNTTSGGGGAT